MITVKAAPRWRVSQLPDATFRWTTPSGRSYAPNPPGTPSSRRGWSAEVQAATLSCITLVG